MNCSTLNNNKINLEKLYIIIECMLIRQYYINLYRKNILNKINKNYTNTNKQTKTSKKDEFEHIIVAVETNIPGIE